MLSRKPHRVLLDQIKALFPEFKWADAGAYFIDKKTSRAFHRFHGTSTDAQIVLCPHTPPSEDAPSMYTMLVTFIDSSGQRRRYDVYRDRDTQALIMTAEEARQFYDELVADEVEREIGNPGAQTYDDWVSVATPEPWRRDSVLREGGIRSQHRAGVYVSRRRRLSKEGSR